MRYRAKNGIFIRGVEVMIFFHKVRPKLFIIDQTLAPSRFANPLLALKRKHPSGLKPERFQSSSHDAQHPTIQQDLLQSRRITFRCGHCIIEVR